jgi:hypothetical protein
VGIAEIASLKDKLELLALDENCLSERGVQQLQVSRTTCLTRTQSTVLSAALGNPYNCLIRTESTGHSAAPGKLYKCLIIFKIKRQRTALSAAPDRPYNCLIRTQSTALSQQLQVSRTTV